MKDGKGTPKKSSKGKDGAKKRRAEAEAAPEAERFDGAPDDVADSSGATEALQLAALHAIAAAKAFLDVAERVVQDPQLAGHALVVVRTVGKGVLGSLSGFGAGPDGDADDDPPLEHIDVG